MSFSSGIPDPNAGVPSCLRIARGVVDGHAMFDKFGNNPSVGTSFEYIWVEGGDLTFLSSAETMNVASSSTDDDGDPAGTGARTVEVEGLDSNYAVITETVTMNGTSNVLTTNSFLRVYRMRVLTAGSTGSNVGIIRATASSAGTVQAHIAATDNQTLQLIYTVPAGKTFYIDHIFLATEKSQDSEIQLMVREEGETFQIKKHVDLFENAIFLEIDYSISAGAKADIIFRGKTSAGTSEISGEIAGVLVDD